VCLLRVNLGRALHCLSTDGILQSKCFLRKIYILFSISSTTQHTQNFVPKSEVSFSLYFHLSLSISPSCFFESLSPRNILFLFLRLCDFGVSISRVRLIFLRGIFRFVMLVFFLVKIWFSGAIGCDFLLYFSGAFFLVRGCVFSGCRGCVVLRFQVVFLFDFLLDI